MEGNIIRGLNTILPCSRQQQQQHQQMMMQQKMGQPQFQVIQPNFSPGPGKYATFQQVSYNAQGQLVLQMPPGQPQLLPGNIMLAPQGMPGGMQVSMAGPPGQAPMMKASDGKPVPPGQQQMQGQPQLIAMPGGGMAHSIGDRVTIL